MKGLTDNGIRELGLLRKRVRRLYGLGRISSACHNDLMQDLDNLQRKFEGAEAPKEDHRVPKPTP